MIPGDHSLYSRALMLDELVIIMVRSSKLDGGHYWQVKG